MHDENGDWGEVSITKKMYGWSKWGGARMGLVKEELDEWNCQVCGEKQTKDLPAYMVAEDESEREFYRVCAKCKHVAVVHKVSTMQTLLTHVKGPTGLMIMRRLANLLSHPSRMG